MNAAQSFRPPQQRGLLFLGLVFLALGGTSAAALLIGLRQQEAGGAFLLLLFTSLILFLPIPLVLYRAYALLRGEYRLERDGLRLRWGLRAEDIPLTEIEWVRRAADLAVDLPLPRLSWPGALLGTVTAHDLGPVEYIASGSESLVLVATTDRIYAISPEDTEGFLRAFRRAFEMGSLTPIASASVLPVAYLASVWANRPARSLLLSGLVLTLLVFLAAGLVISARPSVPLGFQANGMPLEPVPAQQILLLPLLVTFAFLIDTVVGLFLYRRTGARPAAYLVWAASALTAGLFLLAVAFLSMS